jgi:hypothetical protein
MPPNAKYVALYLSTYMNTHQDMAWPSLKRIEGETGLAHATVIKWINFLVSEGWLIKQPGSRTESNRYFVNVPNEVGQLLTYVNQREKVGQPLTSNNNIITSTLSIGDEEIGQAKSKRFKPPTVEEVRDHCQQKGSLVDPERFVAFYESKGWMVGKNKMKSWKSAITTWEKRHADTRPNTGRGEHPRKLSPVERVRAARERRTGGGDIQAGPTLGGDVFDME